MTGLTDPLLKPHTAEISATLAIGAPKIMIWMSLRRSMIGHAVGEIAHVLTSIVRSDNPIVNPRCCKA